MPNESEYKPFKYGEGEWDWLPVGQFSIDELEERADSVRPPMEPQNYLGAAAVTLSQEKSDTDQ